MSITYPGSTTEGITDRQVRFIRSLLNQIDNSQPDLNEEALEMYAGMSKREASKAIDGLIQRRDRVQLDRKTKADAAAFAKPRTWVAEDGSEWSHQDPTWPESKQVTPKAEDPPAGRYALAGEATDGELEFYQVRYGKSGKWAGFLFLDALVGAPMDGRAIPVKKREQPEQYARVLEDIRADVAGAAARFGRETDHCGFCAALLTDRASVAAGYGSTCASNHGLPYPKPSEVDGWAASHRN